MAPRQAFAYAVIQDGPGVAPGLSQEELALPGHDAVDYEQVFDIYCASVHGLGVDDGFACDFFPVFQFLHHVWAGLVVESLMMAVPEDDGFAGLAGIDEGVVSVPFLFCHVPA